MENYELYRNKCEQFDNKFLILVKKGGLSLEVYENHRHIYALGYYKSLWVSKIVLQLGKVFEIKESLSKP